MPGMVGYQMCIETWEKFSFIFYCCVNPPVIAAGEAVKDKVQAIFRYARVKVLQYLNCLMSLDDFLGIQLVSSTLLQYLQDGCVFLLYGCRMHNSVGPGICFRYQIQSLLH